jgi:hypothetical protein
MNANRPPLVFVFGSAINHPELHRAQVGAGVGAPAPLIAFPWL